MSRTLILIREMERVETKNEEVWFLSRRPSHRLKGTGGMAHSTQGLDRLIYVEENQNQPIIIDLEQSFIHYPTHSDGNSVAHIFGSILKFRPDIRRLATRTLMKVSEWYELLMNFSELIITL
ncbi:hypothetical protein EG329_008243 [Mollisiaceae sp. DMI_Dod_QoI]|nr:hypothetical protein EG329_008243 [Helotiales sp. DMI_Dod_QoI]